MEQEPTHSPPESPLPPIRSIEKTALTQTEKYWAIGAHLASVAGWMGVPMGHILAPLIVWIVKKDESEFVRSQAIESLNFQISMTIYALASGLLAITIIGMVIAIPALLALVVGDMILTIVGAVKVSQGERYRYPLTIRLLG